MIMAMRIFSRRQRLLGTLWLLTLAVLASGADARTLRGEVLWQGNVTLEEAVTVPVGARLRIAPGTLVRPLRPEAKIVVQGILEVQGTAEQPVVFDGPEGWEGIEFREGEAGSRIEHGRFARAETAISSNLQSFVLSFSSFADCGTAVRLLRQSSPVIETCRFEDNELGIDIEMKSAPTILRSHFAGHRKVAVLASHSSSGRIEGNTFSANRQGVGLLRGFSGQVVNNLFSENETGIYCDQTRTTPLIRGNAFTDNKTALVNFSFSAPTVDNNTFVGNDTAIRNDQLGTPRVIHNRFLDNRVALHNLRRSSPDVEKNQLENNDVALVCDYSSYPRVKNNNFLNNDLGVRLGIMQSADRERRVGSTGIAREKAIGRQGPNPMMPRMTAEFSDFVDVSGNWWGNDTAKLVAAGNDGNVAIFHDRKDQPRIISEESGSESYLLDVVRFSPWLTGPVVDAGTEPGQ